MIKEKGELLIMEVVDFLQMFIQSTVTLVGFYLVYRFNLKQTEYKNKTEYKLRQCNELLEKIISVIDAFNKKIAQASDEDSNFNLHETMNEVRFLVTCFGSLNALKIMKYIDQLIYMGIDDEEEIPSDRINAAFVVLLMQIRYDITGIKSSPALWYVGEFTSKIMMKNSNYIEDSFNYINQIVLELKLPSFLKVSKKDIKFF